MTIELTEGRGRMWERVLARHRERRAQTRALSLPYMANPNLLRFHIRSATPPSRRLERLLKDLRVLLGTVPLLALGVVLVLGAGRLAGIVSTLAAHWTDIPQ